MTPRVKTGWELEWMEYYDYYGVRRPTPLLLLLARLSRLNYINPLAFSSFIPSIHPSSTNN